MRSLSSGPPWKTERFPESVAVASLHPHKFFSFGMDEPCGELSAAGELVAATPLSTRQIDSGRARTKVRMTAWPRGCRQQGRECKRPSDAAQLATQPHCGATVTPLIHCCMGGLEMDENSDVLGSDSEAIRTATTDWAEFIFWIPWF